MKVNMKRFNRDIPAYLEGMLSERARRRFEGDLAASEACRRELKAYERLLGLTEKHPVEYPSDAAWERFLPRLHRRIERQYARQVRKPPFPVWRPVPSTLLRASLVGAGSLVLLVGMFAAVWSGWLAPVSTAVVGEPVRLTQTTPSSPVEVIADSFLTVKRAQRLATMNPNKVKPSLASDTSVSPILEATANTESAMKADTETESDTAPAALQLMASTLSPVHLYTEEGSYLAAASW